MPYPVMPYAPWAQPGQQQQLDPDLLNAVFGLHQQGPQQQQVQRQLARANAMRTQAGNQMQGAFTGNKERPFYTPPTLLNAAANVYGHYKAGKLEDDAALREQNMGTQRSNTARMYFEALANQTRRQMPYMGEEGE